MDITRATVPGVGIVHHCTTRSGQLLAVLADRPGRSKLLVFGSSEFGGPAPGDSPAADEPAMTIVLEDDEADQLADILHSRPIPDRVADLERRLIEMAGNTP